MWLLYIVALVEGFSTLAVEIIALRIAAPIVGSSSIVTSVFLGVILLALSAGYRQGGKLASELSRDAIHKRIGLYLAGAALFYVCISFSLEQSVLEYLLSSTQHYVFTLFMTALLLFFFPVFIASQTVPLLTELIDTGSKGHAAGKMLFASTVGSFFGSVLTSIVLFQRLGVFLTGIFVSILLLCITAVWLRKSHARIAFALVLISILISCFVLLTKRLPASVVYSFDSAYQEIKIKRAAKNDRAIRVFHTDGSFASAIYEDTKTSPFKYIQETLRITKVKKPRTILVIGAAGFTYPYEAAKQFDFIDRIDVVDVDPAVKEIAEEYFLEDTLSSKVDFIPLSARFILNDALEKGITYDLIFVDAFNGTSIPGELTTQEFFADLQALSPDGMLVMNIIIDSGIEKKLSRRLLSTLDYVYDKVRISYVENKRSKGGIENIIVASQATSPAYRQYIGQDDIYTDDKRSTELDTVDMYRGG